MRLVRLLVPLALVAGVVVAVPVAPASAAGPADPAGRYHPVTPSRLLDTRSAGDHPVAQGATRTVFPESAVPIDAIAVVVTITAVNVSADGYLTCWAGGSVDRPPTSCLQHRAGETRAASVTIPLNDEGFLPTFAVYNSAGSTDLVVDLFGWYTGDGETTTPAAASYYPLALPAREFDSRSSGGPLTNGQTRSVVVDGQTGLSLVGGLQAVAVNLTVVAPKGSGFLQAWNGLGNPPGVSNVNFAAGRTVSNFAVVPVRCLDTGGCTHWTFSVRNVSTSADVLVDVLGVYATAAQSGASRYFPLGERVVDTRTPLGFGRLGPNSSGTADTDTTNTATAANLTVTVVKPSAPTYLSALPGTATTPPAVSTMNPRAGEILTNATQVRLTGINPPEFKVYNFAGTTDVVVDAAGVFLLEAS